MNVQSRLPTTADEFLAWNEGRQGKREFVKGRVVEMMINVSRRHVRLATNLLMQLSSQLDGQRYDVGTADFAVRTPTGVRYPDVFVDERTAESDPADLAARKPVLLAEILSETSYKRDFGEKVGEYTAIGSLQFYLVLAQDEPRLWLWSRADKDWQGPVLHSERQEPVVLAGLGMSIDLAKLYAGIID
jgi:Uma2 family endonuclease